MSSVVLDASALLALLNDEPGASIVEAALPDSIICSVNLCEVAGVLADTGMPIDMVRALLADLALNTTPFDDGLALAAAALRPSTKKAGLSLGDRACLALAQSKSLPALTADRQWSRAGLDTQLQFVR